MNLSPLPTHEALKAEIGEQDALAMAIAEMERRAAGAVSQESANGWRHALIICRSGWSVPHKLWQLRYHATRERSEPAPVKAAAFREAMALVMALTGEEPKREIVRDHEHDAPEEPFALVST